MVVMKDGEEVIAPCLFYSMGRVAIWLGKPTSEPWTKDSEKLHLC
jgi:hypothetical protein